MPVGVPGLPQRVLGAVLLQAAVDQRQATVGVGPEVELGEGLVAPRGAVVAVAVGVHPRGIHQETDAVALAFRVQVVRLRPSLPTVVSAPTRGAPWPSRENIWITPPALLP
ncbi:hypothetical protein AB1K01_00185 [Pseudomonas paraeruginosa]|uniref:hypothetical protein n=1 Tax=Pseudomonas paraeruginosa TaxID=2994495 RepID=UPI003D2E12C2